MLLQKRLHLNFDSQTSEILRRPPDGDSKESFLCHAGRGDKADDHKVA